MADTPPSKPGFEATLADHSSSDTIAVDSGAQGQRDSDDPHKAGSREVTQVASPRGREPSAESDTEISHPRTSHARTMMSQPIAEGPGGELAPIVPRVDVDFDERYSGGDLLGRGGMGEVCQYQDSVIGRSVAVKFLRGAGGAESTARFIREARVQGQLQHPAVVPVYDIGLRGDGETFFTMKKLGGRTLGEIIIELRDGNAPEVVHRRRQLLTAFSDVCLAVDYAHSRGVIHRDLKPVNIMLGDFGEVYVLDWGLARLADDPEASKVLSRTGESGETAPIAEAAGVTSFRGAVMGTIGYMAPEQLRGEPLGPSADVYALGSMLFELLTLEPLHHGATAKMMAATTLEGTSKRVSERAEVHALAPELEQLCLDATEKEISSRLSSARQLYERLEGFLAGDRDLARRIELAAELADLAESDAQLALENGDLDARRKAMQTASRALALDPEQADAPKVLMQLLLSPPSETPPEVLELLADKRQADNRRHARLGAAGYGSWLIAFPLFLWMGVIDWTLGVAMGLAVATCAAASVVGARRRRIGTGLLVAGTLINAVTLFLLTRLLGPLILVPTLAVSTSLAFTLYGRRVAAIMGPVTSVIAIVAAVACEASGLIPSSYRYVDGELRVISEVLMLRPVATTVTLTALVCAAILVAAWFVAQVRSNLDRAEAANMTMVWQYRQLAPDPD